jgi:hypothetical protein
MGVEAPAFMPWGGALQLPRFLYRRRLAGSFDYSDVSLFAS